MRRYTRSLIVALTVVVGVVAGFAGDARAQCLSDKLLASDGQPDDNFGGAVSISGSTALVGASGKDDSGADSGAAYVFEYTGTGWVETDMLLAQDGAADDHFGRSVALSGDFAVIGASGDDDLGSNSGSAYVFERVGTAWGFKQKLIASDGAAGDGFAESVAISGDRIAVAARGHDVHPHRGSVYIFDRLGTTWVETAEVLQIGGYGLPSFAASVALFGDRLLVGAPYYEHEPNGPCHGCGAGLIFELVGSSWVQTAQLDPTLVPGAGSGTSVSLWGDTAVVGVGYNERNAYLFEYDGASWVQHALFPADAVYSDYFGSSVAVSGSFVLVGSPADDDLGSGSGSAYSYAQVAGSWIQVAKLHAYDGKADDHFGFGGVSISENGTFLIGASGDDDLGSSSGSAYVIPGGWGASTYCSTSPNSVGPGANICWLGSTSLTANNMHLIASGCPPDQFLLFYYGLGTDNVPFGNGVRCVNDVGIGFSRFRPFLTDPVGNAIMKVDTTMPPVWGGGLGVWYPGDTWYCQGYYRDPAGGGAGFNLTDGLEVVVWP